MLGLTARIAELEYSIAGRSRHPRDGSLFASYCRSKVDGYFASLKINQNEARIDYKLTPLLSLLSSTIGSLRQSMADRVAARLAITEDEDRLMLQIDDLNHKRDQLKEDQLGSYNYRKVSEVDSELDRLKADLSLAGDEERHSALDRLEEKCRELRQASVEVAQRVESGN